MGARLSSRSFASRRFSRRFHDFVPFFLFVSSRTGRRAKAAVVARDRPRLVVIVVVVLMGAASGRETGPFCFACLGKRLLCVSAFVGNGTEKRTARSPFFFLPALLLVPRLYGRTRARVPARFSPDKKKKRTSVEKKGEKSARQRTQREHEGKKTGKREAGARKEIHS